MNRLVLTKLSPIQIVTIPCPCILITSLLGLSRKVVQIECNFRFQVDTSRFRRAIWNYSQSLFGIRHDDYDYAEVNALIERSLKAFIKSGSCYPERVTKNEYDRVLREFEHSEKVCYSFIITIFIIFPSLPT